MVAAGSTGQDGMVSAAAAAAKSSEFAGAGPATFVNLHAATVGAPGVAGPN